MPRLQKLAFVLAGLFALIWSIIRARLQSVTMDEADTYFWFVAKSEVFFPYPNNHVLNTLLMWVSTHLFGLSSLTVRLPALFGAVVYIGAAYLLCRSITDKFSLQFPLFACLLYNPFILDFMVAARGYGLANAFLLLAIAILLSQRSCAWASVALGLSFCSNFSFAFADLAVLIALLIWGRGPKWLAIVPGLVVTLVICGYPLAHWKKEDLFYGGQSLKEMGQSLVDATLYHINPRVHGSWFKVMRFLYPKLLPTLGILCICQLFFSKLTRTFSIVLTVISLPILFHWLAFHFAHVPLPLSRTAIFLLPLCTLFAGVMAAGGSKWLGRGITVTLACLACYFLVCLRLSYFKEYEYGADTKDVYAELARLNHTYGVTDVATNGVYTNPLNFYRILSNKETFPEFLPVEGELPAGRAIYVMFMPSAQSFIDQQRLGIIYQSRSRDIVIAVKPGGQIPDSAAY